MLPICFHMQEDELYQGWLYAISQAINLPFALFARYYLPNTGNVSQCKYISNMDNNVRIYNKANRFFPDLYDIIENHTDYVVARYGMGHGWADRTIEYMLRDNNLELYNFNIDTYKTCPVCQKEDTEKYWRPIIHVSHQINGVKMCYKHGIPLSNERIDNKDIELNIAVFANNLFHIKADYILYDLAKYISVEDIDMAVSERYISYDEGQRILKAGLRHKQSIAKSIVRYLAWKFKGNVNDLIHNIPNHTYTKIDTDLFAINRIEYGIGEFTCKKCGKMFHMSYRAVGSGSVCPYCGSGMTDQEQMTRILSRYKDGNYIYQNGYLKHTLCGHKTKASSRFWLNDSADCVNCHKKSIKEWERVFAGTEFDVVDIIGKNTQIEEWNKSLIHRWVQLKHKPCGTVFEIKAKTEYKSNKDIVFCPVCEKEHPRFKGIRKSKIGERRVGVNGIGCEVIDYYVENEIFYCIVRFDNGLERNMRWEHFANIGTGSRDRLPELYVGLKNTMKDGQIATIIRYEGYTKLLVELQDGSLVWSNIRSFRRGTITEAK